eukprot:jgi/Tetstr1/458651/TSEL_045044.t1
MACSVPTSCTQVESAVFPAPLASVWPTFKVLALDKVAAEFVSSAAFVPAGGEMKVGAVIKLEYSDGASWELRVTEISERTATVAYEVVSTQPSLDCTSITGEISLSAVTASDETFIRWTTEYSNDVTLERIQDQKFKKLEIFKAAIAALTSNKRTFAQM